MILILKHIGIEGPGSLGTFLKNRFKEIKTIELYKEERLPERLDGVQAIVILGGPMNVYEEEKYPFLKDEDRFLKSAIENEIPLLGICLGAQLIAKACDAKVFKAKEEEIGWRKVTLTLAGKKDKIFENLPHEFDVFQWHGDTFGVPKGGELLVTSSDCVNQGFRYKNAYGFQFHIEVTKKEISEWSEAYHGKENREMIDDYHQREEKLLSFANELYNNFSSLTKE